MERIGLCGQIVHLKAFPSLKDTNRPDSPRCCCDIPKPPESQLSVFSPDCQQLTGIAAGFSLPWIVLWEQAQAH